MKYVIISNRLPFTITHKNGGLHLARSSGGLATGLASLETPVKKCWVGWPGMPAANEEERQLINSHIKKKSLRPVHLTSEQVQDYYEGYSNGTLWPLCHYFYSYMQSDARFWNAYKEVNRLFCEEALKVISPGDMVWVHDYQLMLLPAMIREKMPDVGIGYFHHIPFPSYELFRCLPERAEILRGLMGADLVGFHTHEYMRHFINALYRVLGLHCNIDEVRQDGRVTRMEAFPMGINYNLYNKAAEQPAVLRHVEKLQRSFAGCKVVLSVDRLDYSKGIINRLKAFANFLEHNPEMHNKVVLLLIVVPSRDSVTRYAELKTEIDTMIGSVNGRFSSPGWTPVQYYYRSLSFNHLAAMYKLADVALITPLRDGMNLIAKEYLAAKGGSPGVLVFSEMAGAALELPEAVTVNPNDLDALEEAIGKALNMPEDEQLAALQPMQRHLARHTVSRWAENFMTELKDVRARNREIRAKLLEGRKLEAVRRAYKKGKRRLLLLDYDGTLRGFVKNPANAQPPPSLLELLRKLAEDPRNHIMICSGRTKENLEKWLGGLNIGLSAEHGAFYYEGGIWRSTLPQVEDHAWDEEILSIFERITDKTPRSYFEKKSTALVWHFRDVDDWLADLRVTQLLQVLMRPCARKGLQIMRGSKIVEVKSPACNKGTEAQRLLSGADYDFILCMGDDVTDEDMFALLPPEAVSIKVGGFSDSARYHLMAQNQVTGFLSGLTYSPSRV